MSLKGLVKYKISKRRRLLLLYLPDSGEVVKVKANKRTRNGKTTIYGSWFKHRGEMYEVYKERSGLYKEILVRIIDQISIALKIHKRLLVVRFDLHSQIFGESNREISLFRKQIIQWIGRNYETNNVFFIWVREKGKADHQHYHLAVAIDGDKIRHPKRLLGEIKSKWEAKDPCNNHASYVKSPYHLITKESGIHEAVKRLSYFAKTKGKGYRPTKVNDFRTSRLK